MYQGNLHGIEEIHQRLRNYWQGKAPSYYVPDVFGRRVVAAFMRKLHPKSLVEVGCGSGELFAAYKDVPLVLGIDWSAEMLKRSKERIERHDYKNIQLQQLDISVPMCTCEHEDRKRFDVALTRTCLMHIDPDHIDQACRNLTSLSDSIVVFEFYDPCATKLDWHNWHHEYPSIFQSLGFALTESYDRPDGIHQTLFHFIPEVAKK